jgi:hypothetical protein
MAIPTAGHHTTRTTGAHAAWGAILVLAWPAGRLRRVRAAGRATAGARRRCGEAT